MMQLQDLYQRVVDRPGRATLHGLPEILDDHFQDTEALIIKPPFARQPEKHAGYIALVGNDPESVLDKGLLFNPDSLPSSGSEVRTLELPTDPQQAMNVLLQLEYADLILFVLDTNERLSSHHLHWLMRMEILKVPIVLLVNNAERVHKRLLPRLLQTLDDRLKIPAVPVYTNEPEHTRALLVETLFAKAPRLAAMASLQFPVLRPVLVQHLLTSAAQHSLGLDAQASTDHDLSQLSKAQVRLAQQIKAVYGKGTKLSAHEYENIRTMAATATHYATTLTRTLPARNPARRARVVNAVSTLILGYLALVSHGETPPDIRTQVLPEIWRLYRASGQMASQ
jgi:hypothetical protein